MNTAIKILSLALGIMLIVLSVMSAGCNTEIPLVTESSAESTESTETSENGTSAESAEESSLPEAGDSSEELSSEEPESDSAPSEDWDESEAGSEESEESEESEADDPYGDERYSYATDISEFYDAIVLPDEPDKFLVLVNKDNKLGRNDVPENLVDCVNTRDDGRDTQKLVYEAELALQAFLNEARANGIDDVSVTSAYRGYYTQDYLFEMYVDRELHKFDTREEAEEYVSTYSSRPGTSEHQTGLCLDMHNLSAASQAFGETEAAEWLADNAYKFGYILRYPEDKEDITEIMWEPWHFRFVGRYHATRITELGLCLEEYIEAYYPEQIQD